MAASNYRIMDLQESDRPRERLAEVGARALNSAELLAILLRVGVVGENAVQMGHRLLNTFGGLAGLQKASFAEISTLHGVGPAKAAQIMAALELGRRLASDLQVETRTPISSPKDAADLVQYEMSSLIHEELWVLLLDTRNRVNRIERLYKGSLNSSTVRIAELFRPAIQQNAASIIMIHNHPSGDPSPSPEDIQLTRSAVLVGRQMDIPVLDHLVIGGSRFVSLKERRLGFD